MNGAVTKKKKKDGKISVKQKPMNKSHSERRFRGTLIEGITYHVEYVRLDSLSYNAPPCGIQIAFFHG